MVTTYLNVHTIKAGATQGEIDTLIKEIVAQDKVYSVIREQKSGAVIAFIHFDQIFTHER